MTSILIQFRGNVQIIGDWRNEGFSAGSLLLFQLLFNKFKKVTMWHEDQSLSSPRTTFLTIKLQVNLLIDMNF